jgi:hemin uptake protein HemP
VPPSNADGRPASPAAADARAESRPCVRSVDLFAGRREVVIVHGDDEYRLRITRAGKLILTK